MTAGRKHLARPVDRASPRFAKESRGDPTVPAPSLESLRRGWTDRREEGRRVSNACSPSAATTSRHDVSLFIKHTVQTSTRTAQSRSSSGIGGITPSPLPAKTRTKIYMGYPSSSSKIFKFSDSLLILFFRSTWI